MSSTMTSLKKCINNHLNKNTMKFSNIYCLAVICLVLAGCSASSQKEGDSSAEPVPGVTDTEIVIGSWGPLTGPAALWGNVIKGADAYFSMLNDEGGVNGRQIRYIMKDDAYDPSQTVPAVRELVQREEVFAVTAGIGTAPGMAVMDFLQENGVPWFCPMTGASAMTHPPKENIYSVFPLYYDEARVMATMAIDDLGSEKIGIIYQNDDFGKSGLVGVQSILNERGLEFAAALPVEPTDSDLSSHVARLKESGAETVFLWILPRQAAITLGSSSVIDYKPNWFASLVLSDIALMHNITKGAWEGVYFSYASPVLFSNTENETVARYKAAYEKKYPEDRWNNFAYTGMLLMEPMGEALKRSGQELTREGLLETFSQMNDFTNSVGLPISFSGEQHLGTNSIYVMRCISATEAENISGPTEGDADVAALNAMMEGSL